MAGLAFSRQPFQTFPDEFYLFIFNGFLRENGLILFMGGLRGTCKACSGLPVRISDQFSEISRKYFLSLLLLKNCKTQVIT